MNRLHYDIANSLMADVEKGQRASLTKKINQLIDENAELGKIWGSVAQLALTIGDNDSAVKTVMRYYLSNKHQGEEVLLKTLHVLGQTGRLKQAQELTQSISPSTKSPSLAHFCGVMYSQLGDFEVAKAFFNRVLELAPNSAPTMLSLISISNEKEAATELEIFKKSEQAIGQDAPLNKVQFYYALAKAAELSGNTQLAYDYVSTAAKIYKMQVRNPNYEIGEEFLLSQQISEYFDQDFVNKYSVNVENNTNEPEPIFILGLPRSGTTLLSQMLKHNEAYSGGKELNYCRRSLLPLSLKQIINSKSDAKQPKIVKGIVEHFRNEYLYRLQSNEGQSRYFIDKSLDLSRYAGLLAAAFPKAKFVYIQRNEKDVAWSCYKHFFNNGVPWSCDIAEIKHFFDDYNMQISHCQTILSDRMMSVQYEGLVSSPKQLMASIAKFVGTSFEEVESKLEQDEQNFVPANSASIATNSLYQVRQAVSKRYIGTSKPIEQHFNLFNCE